MESEFEQRQTIADTQELAELSARLNLSVPTIKVWFKNRRLKFRCQNFEDWQLEILEAQFEKRQFVVGMGRELADLSANLGLSVSTIKIWFKNRRKKLRVQNLKNEAI